jgi:hypothetical protein
MCGVVGILQYESEVSREIRHRALKILFSELMRRTESRGTDATGLYQVHKMRPDEDYGDWAMTKKGTKASEWLFLDSKESDDPVVYSDFMNAWMEHDQEMTALVGHCRKATVGSRGLDNDDNHPFIVQVDEKNAILGIHNGTLTNHETIFRKLPDLLKRQGQVDSESIFHLMFHLSEHGTKPWDHELMVSLGKRLDGAAACIVVNSRFPHQVATWRFGRPMEYCLVSPLNIVIVSSERKFIEEAIGSYNLYKQLFDPELPSLRTHTTVLSDKDYRIFDTSQPWPAGVLGHKDLNEISTRGDMKPFNSPLEEGWYTPAASSGTTKAADTKSTGNGHIQDRSHLGRYSGSGGNHSFQARDTKAAASSQIKTLPATVNAGKDPNDNIVVVEVEIGSQEEAQRGFEKAKSMGLCPHVDSDREIALTLGITQPELSKLSLAEVVNLVAQSHFNLGYAISRFDTSAEIEKTRKLGRGQGQRLEKLESKKRGAENKIWELKQLINFMLALDDSGYKITEQNIAITLSGMKLAAFVSLSESRKKDILQQAKSIFADPESQRIIGELRREYVKAKKAREAKKKREHRAVTAGD